MACVSSFGLGFPSRRLRSASIVTCAAAILILFASFSRAQQAPPDPPPNPPQTFPVLDPDSSYRYAIKELGIDPAAEFGIARVGKINDDPRDDVVVLRGTSPVVFLNPATWDAALRVPLEGTSAAVLPGTANGRDEILVTTAQGLRGAWRDTTASFATRTIGADGLWAGADFVATAQLDGVDGVDIYGVRNDLGFAGVLLADISGIGDGFYDEILIALDAFPVEAGTAADLDGNGLRSLAFASASGLHVYHEDDLFDAYTVGDGGYVATIASGMPGKERIAWITSVSGSGDVLYFVDEAGLSSPVVLGGTGVIGLHAADLDHDGDDDLVTSITRSHDLVVYWNDNGTFDDDARTVLAVGETGFAPDNAATPTTADLDGDGDTDLFHAIQSSETAFVWNNTHTASAQTTPQLKIQKTRMFGGDNVEVHLIGDYFDDTLAAAQAWCAEKGGYFLSPFDDADVIEGQASIAVEIEAQLGKAPDHIVLPVGGGGMSSGVVQYFGDDVHALLVEPEGGACLKAALEAGQPVPLVSWRNPDI